MYIVICFDKVNLNNGGGLWVMVMQWLVDKSFAVSSFHWFHHYHTLLGLYTLALISPVAQEQTHYEMNMYEKKVLLFKTSSFWPVSASATRSDSEC